MVKAIIFDLDDTLLNDQKSINEAFKATCHLAAEKYQVNPVQMEETVREYARELYATYPTYDFIKKIGINALEGLWGIFNDPGEDFQALHKIAPMYQLAVWKKGLEAMGIDDENFALTLAKAFPANRKKYNQVFDDTYAVLEELKGNYFLFMLTNGAPSLQNTKLELSPKLKTYFDRVFISGEFGIGKPDPSIFQHVLESIGLTKDDAIMVGDNLNTDILGANRIGMKNVWINRGGKKATEIQPTYEIRSLKEIIPTVKKSSSL